jgi:nickel transport protein
MILLGISLVHAHRANIFTQTQGDKVLCQCFYNDGKPVRGQDIQVRTQDGRVIAEGTTDDKGMFSFTPQVHEDLEIVLNAGMGHTAEITLEKEDLPKTTQKTSVKTAKKSSPAEKRNEVREHDSDFDEERLRGIIEQVVDEKLQPVIEGIQKQQRSHSLITIIGCIGYIVGIFGLYMFWKSRKKR